MKAKKLTALFLSVALAAVSLVGCGSSNDKAASADKAGADETVTIRFFDKNSGTMTFDDRIALEIQKRTGIKIELENPTGDSTEKLNLMLTGQNYPDIVMMDRGDDIVNRYIEAGALIPLNDLIEEYGPNVKEMYGDVLNKSRYEDGKNYYLNNWYGKDPDASQGMLMRRDLLAEIVGEERACSPEPFTQAEFIDILKKFKELHPQIDGKESIALTCQGEYPYDASQMYGIIKYYEKDGNLYNAVKHPNYLKAMTFVNSLYTEGLLDKEWVVNKSEQLNQKASAGLVFAFPSCYWGADGINPVLAENIGPEAQFYSYKIVGEGMDPSETRYNGRSTLGWDAIGITSNCKNPEAAMKLMDFLCSEEGQYLQLWGIEGEDWNMVDGKHVPNQELVEGFLTDFNTTKLETGVRKWIWFVKNGNGKDGTPYDMSTKYQLQPTAEFARQAFGDSDWYDTADLEGLEPAGSTPEGLKLQKIDDIRKKSVPNIINAANAEEAEAVYNAMLDEMEKAGLADVEGYISGKYQERMELWGIEK